LRCSVYDAAKRIITGTEDADDETFTVQLLAGGTAGGAAAGEDYHWWRCRLTRESASGAACVRDCLWCCLCEGLPLMLPIVRVYLLCYQLRWCQASQCSSSWGVATLGLHMSLLGLSHEGQAWQSSGISSGSGGGGHWQGGFSSGTLLLCGSLQFLFISV